MPKKKFIDKKNSVTFYLAHRSQRDPLAADETAPQRVLVPIEQAGGALAPCHSGPGPSKETKLKRLEEQAKYGIYFDDDYDYLQHLKDSKEVSTEEWDVCERIYAPQLDGPKETKKPDDKDAKLMLPSSVFGSKYEENVGLLNKAAKSYGPRPDLDLDVVNALEDDFDFGNPENELEDDFIQLANEGKGETKLTEEDMDGLFSDDDEEGGDSDDYEDMSDEDGDEEERGDRLGRMMKKKYADFDEEETRSHFTNYSMSSSVLRRNEQLTLLDERFEKMYEGYEDNEIGALDCDDIEGFLGPESDLVLKYADEFHKQKNAEVNLNEKIAQLALKQQLAECEEDEDESMEMEEEEDVGEKEKWDCETIISTYSTTKNRPRLIKEPSKMTNIIKVSGKTGIPLGVLGVGLTKEKLKELDREYEATLGTSGPKDNGMSVMSGISTVRGKDETPEERHERKKLVKEYRRERRTERKANKDAFKDEKKRQVKVRLNCVANVQGLKL